MPTPDGDESPGFSLNCPLPKGDHKEIQLAHGGGGRLTQKLIDDVFLPAFESDALRDSHDGAFLNLDAHQIAFSTDSHVIRPIEFPGGDIGSLSIHGTCNDIAMCGARPRWLSAGFILEEGLPIATLCRIVASMRKAADEIGLKIVTGDTKVVERGKGDGIYINTAGIGEMVAANPVKPASVRPGDVVLVSGDIGRHGMAIMARREGLEFETTIESDSAHVWPAVEALLGRATELHCLRDLTRGGLAAAMHEIAVSSGTSILLNETDIACEEAVSAACEILGLDPLHVANEGRFVAILPEASAQEALQLLRTHAPGGEKAALIGRVEAAPVGEVRLKSVIGVERILDRPSGEQLPRIC